MYILVGSFSILFVLIYPMTESCGPLILAEVYKENETHKILSSAKPGTPRKCLCMCWKSPHGLRLKQI